MRDSPPTRGYRITTAHFRAGSTCPSHRQAPFCRYALCVRVPTALRGPCARLRYSFGGDRPSQTAHLPRSPVRFHGTGLGSKHHQGGISPLPPPKLALQLLRLPPILHKQCPNSMTGCSKAPRGLFVQLRVGRIFTAISISPGPSLRQCSSCYAVRAGRNLPDKEFRYLRTVIVTAAVHRGFSSKLRLASNLSL